MRARRTTSLFLIGWRVAARLPEDVVRAAMHVAADVAWLRRGGGVRQLEANLARVRPAATPQELRQLSREGVRTYLRYFGETFMLGRMTQEQMTARVLVQGAEGIMAEVTKGRSVVLALGHQGNYDLAGAWASAHLAPVTTVAERLEPPDVFDEFVRLREGFGLTIVPLDAGSDAFRELIRAVRAGGILVPLLADRDLTARGVEVDLFGQVARVAAGPAVLAVSTGAALFPTTIRHVRLRGAGRRAAGSRWGIALTFHEALPAPDDGPRGERVQRLTQAWVDVLGADIAAHPTHWHMLQKVFVADLDPQRDAATRAGAEHAEEAT
ncbi:phosphatidylinositol mannoside acyltransferase [Cellulomonas sp. KRMCY2]|uniref:phosphatidylinositol mannoside acyltransferase n=1 Tax=Cellulomonas sp. KRMCY2 TaxID=1304865 RepID=UPI00045E81E1|nr:phosphatidylinositol mannoside acyltransferase [Cellulomonas sp. KRMCY2]